MDNSIVAQAIELAGGASRIAEQLNLRTPWAVNKWKRSFPPERARWLAEATGWKVTPHQLAPQLYPNPDDALPRKTKKASAVQAAEGSKRKRALA